MKYEYDNIMAGNTATMILYYPETDEVLLGLRGKNSNAFPNYWSLPGGYLNVGAEILVETAVRETQEETGLFISSDRWINFFLDDKPGSDPRYLQVINQCYYATVSKDEYNSVKADDDLQEVKWTDLGEALKLRLPFNHNEILMRFSILF